MLRTAYDYAQGFHKRQLLDTYIAAKKRELSEVSPLRSASAVPAVR